MYNFSKLRYYLLACALCATKPVRSMEVEKLTAKRSIDDQVVSDSVRQNFSAQGNQNHDPLAESSQNLLFTSIYSGNVDALKKIKCNVDTKDYQGKPLIFCSIASALEEVV